MSKSAYTAPAITVVHIKAEHGYALSAGILDPEQVQMDLMMLGMNDDGDYRQTETFNVQWYDGEDNGFFN